MSDQIGFRGEALFRQLITKWCDDRMWFVDTFLGEKAETKDYVVNLIGPTCGTEAQFFVQVKSTSRGCTKPGPKQKLKASVSKKDVEKLKALNAPAYIVGIDIIAEKGYLLGITQQSAGKISGIPTKHPLNCTSIKKLWKELDAYWKQRGAMSLASTHFG